MNGANGVASSCQCRYGLPGRCEYCDPAGELARYKERCHRADHIILLLTADHNSGPNYVKGFDMAQEYFQDFHDDWPD